MRPLRCAEGGHLSVNRILNENAGQTCRLQTYRLQSGRVIRNCGSNSGLFKVRSRIQSARSVTAGFATCGDGGVIFASHPNMFQLTIGTYATKLSSRQDIDRLLRRAKYAGCCFPPNARVGSADGCAEWCRVLLTGLGSPSPAISRSVPCEAYYHMIFEKSHVQKTVHTGLMFFAF